MLQFLAIIGGIILCGWLVDGLLRLFDQLECGRQARQAAVTGRDLDEISDTRSSRDSLIHGATMSPLRQDLLPTQLDEFCRDTLLQLYGPEWLRDNEDLLRAMLSFVDDFQMVDSARLRKYWDDDWTNDVRACCLFSIFDCMRIAGVFTQPSIPKQTADIGGFMLAFSKGNIMSVDDPKSTMFTLGLAINFASQDNKAA